jgi:hypothetical protein
MEIERIRIERREHDFPWEGETYIILLNYLKPEAGYPPEKSFSGSYECIKENLKSEVDRWEVSKPLILIGKSVPEEIIQDFKEYCSELFGKN